MQQLLAIDIVVIKTTQIVVFSLLLGKLVSQRCRRVGSIGTTPVWISAIFILNGVASLFQLWAVDNYYFRPHQDASVFVLMTFIDDCTFLISMWLFGSLILETTLNIESVII